MLTENYQINAYESHYAYDLAQIFHTAVMSIDEHDYSDRQKRAWAGGGQDVETLMTWQRRFDASKPLIATDNKQAVGFIEFLIDKNADNKYEVGHAYIDCLYVLPKYQNRGIAKRLYNEVESKYLTKHIKVIWVHASKTAYSFFLKQGFEVVEKQAVKRQDVTLLRYLMRKSI